MIFKFDSDKPFYSSCAEVDGDALMRWAKENAPLKTMSTTECVPGSYRKCVRLEIVAESVAYTGGMSQQFRGYVERTFARVYLAEPRCVDNHNDYTIQCNRCECGSLAERRIG